MIAAIVALGTAFGFGIKQARASGKQEEHMGSVTKQLHDHDIIIAEHTANIAEHEGTFKAIKVSLEYIQKSIDGMSAKLDRHVEEIEK